MMLRHVQREQPAECKPEQPGVRGICERAVAAERVIDEWLEIVDEEVREFLSVALRRELHAALSGRLVVADCDQNHLAHQAGAREICRPNVCREGFTVGRGATLQGMLSVEQVEHRKLRVAGADVAGRQPNVDLALFVQEVCVELALEGLAVEEIGSPRVESRSNFRPRVKWSCRAARGRASWDTTTRPWMSPR